MIHTTTHVYKQLPNGGRLVVDVYSPTDEKPGEQRPTAVFFHGGGWQGGTREQFAPQARELCKRGMVCLTPEYRTGNSHGTSPQVALADAKSALRWIRTHANQLGIDPDRFAIGGGSAGGHLAAAALTCPGFDDPLDDVSIPIEASALILFNPVTDNGPDGGYGYERIREDFPAFSPAHNIRSNLPPTLFMLGTNDNLIPVDTAERFQERMHAAGNECLLKLYDGGEHGFFNYKDGDNHYFEATLQDMIRFIADLEWIEDSDRP